eukprot:166605_1
MAFMRLEFSKYFKEILEFFKSEENTDYPIHQKLIEDGKPNHKQLPTFNYLIEPGNYTNNKSTKPPMKQLTLEPHNNNNNNHNHNQSITNTEPNHSDDEEMEQTENEMCVNVLYIGCSNGQFYAKTVDERKQIVTRWVEEFRALNPDVFVIWMIASTEVEDAIELANYAGNVLHVNAISSLQQYYY